MSRIHQTGLNSDDGDRRPEDPAAALIPLLSVGDVARLLGVPAATLYQWRYQQKGPPGFRVGRHLRYRPGDVQLWVDECRAEETRGQDARRRPMAF
jgi:predicted DNA-binding transcriptional regulator AlpA